jgi:hypothetical protein
MTVSGLIDAPRPVSIKRLPWMQRIHLYSPKAGRMLVLFSQEALGAWALAEGCPLITSLCEHPGYVEVDSRRMMADFWVQGDGREQFVKLEGGIDLTAEGPGPVPTYTDVEVSRVTSDWLRLHADWIDNWLRISPYLVANARFVTPAMIERVASLFNEPRALFDAEHAVRDMDPQLARTAVFMLLHQGRLGSDDLLQRPLAGTTVFRHRTG